MSMRTIWAVAVTMSLGCASVVESEEPAAELGEGGAASDGGAEASPPDPPRPIPCLSAVAPDELVTYCLDMESLSTPVAACSLAADEELKANPLCFPAPAGGYCCCTTPDGSCSSG